MKVLIYRQTHTNDPCPCGVFGIRDCMGRIRGWDYNAVIGIGALANPIITGKLTWIGINPKNGEIFKRAPLVTFKHFCRMDERGPMLGDCAPLLNRYVNENFFRFVISDSLGLGIQEEIDNLVNQYRRCPPSRKKCQCEANEMCSVSCC